jgi:hypothetical protein
VCIRGILTCLFFQAAFIGGFTTKLVSVRILGTGRKLSFTQKRFQIIFQNLPKEERDAITGVTIFALEFEGPPEAFHFPTTSALNRGRVYSWPGETP